MLGKLLKKGATKAIEAPNKLLGKFAEELSGVSEEALRKAKPVSKGAKALKVAAGTQRKIGKKILNNLENLDEFLPESGIINKALKDMPPVNIFNSSFSYWGLTVIRLSLLLPSEIPFLQGDFESSS